jgi:predicted transcriptional regulator
MQGASGTPIPFDRAERKVAEQAASTSSAHAEDPGFRQSLLKVLEEIVHKLPDHATLGELIEETRKSRHLRALLTDLTVLELIEMAKSRPEGAPSGNGKDAEIVFDEEGNPILNLQDAASAVVRRRADVPDGDIRVLRCLADEGALNENAISRHARLTTEQVRLIVRHLRTKGLIHVEGSGGKRRIKITRNGSGYLRRNA